MKTEMTIQTNQAFIKQFNGRKATLHIDKETAKPTVGASGNTKLYNLDAGTGLFLADDEVKA